VSEVVGREISQAEFFALLNTSSTTYLVVIDSLCERVRRLRRIINDIYATINPSASDRESIFEAARSVESVAQLAEQRLVRETKDICGAKPKKKRWIAPIYTLEII
jgi:hypothetical protein